MRREQLPLYAIALAIGIVGLVALGVPVGTLALLLVFLACPLMMVFMMRGMHGGDMHGGHGPSNRDDDTSRPDRMRKHDPHDHHQHGSG
ncbi:MULTISPECIES: DUF2933 domain-containing protein [Streptomyces]|uniref:DUF2933 domain-containing protein n=1 Tax=Streptomyces TaxID=1883 RepID=UPI00345F3791